MAYFGCGRKALFYKGMSEVSVNFLFSIYFSPVFLHAIRSDNKVGFLGTNVVI